MKLILALLTAAVLGAMFLMTARNSASDETARSIEPRTTAASETMNQPNSDSNRANAAPTVSKQPVLVELFTSEGCSSCPSADKALQFYLKEQPFNGAEIIALSEHVDYWNRLGWTDPFSSAQFSQRQSEYSGFFGQNGNVYTPQMVVDGTREFVGSNAREAQKAIGEAAKTSKAAIDLTVRREKETLALDIKVTDLPVEFESAIVLLAIAEDDLTSSVARGENGGQKLTHVAVARSLTNVGIVKSGSKTYAVAPIVKLQKSWKTDNLSAVAFVQNLKTRQIYAVAKTSLKNAAKL